MGTTARDLMDSEDPDQPKATKPRRQLQEAAARTTTTRGAAPRCRVCAAVLQRREHAARIFGEEGRRRNLQAHIQKYLHITVSSEDKLPKMVCASCIGKLDGIHAFATLAQRSQEKLRQELLRRPADLDAIVDNSSNSDSSANKLGDRSLLHSILTKGTAEASSDGKMSQRRQRTPSTEEMEVKVDPMLFLQCALEQPTSVDCSDYSDDSDRDTSSYCSPDSEPLSLTNKAAENLESRNEENLDSERKLVENEQADNEEANESCEEDEEFDEVEEGSSSPPGARSHCCKLCGRAFASQIGLQNHLWSHLPAAEPRDKGQAAQAHRPAAAASPNSSCSESNGLLAGGSYICPICGKRISTKGNLKVHLETHRPKGKYGCDICGRIFKTQSNLFRHKEYHSGVQFPCSVCGRVYPTNSTLRAHSITHSDLRPHACPLCDKTFKRNQDLKFHINQHTGARPYQCPYCPKAFASSGNCFSHRKRMHPKEVHRDRQRAADLMR